MEEPVAAAGAGLEAHSLAHMDRPVRPDPTEFPRIRRALRAARFMNWGAPLIAQGVVPIAIIVGASTAWYIGVLTVLLPCGALYHVHDERLCQTVPAGFAQQTDGAADRNHAPSDNRALSARPVCAGSFGRAGSQPQPPMPIFSTCRSFQP
jgi:hypothetical protein